MAVREPLVSSHSRAGLSPPPSTAAFGFTYLYT